MVDFSECRTLEDLFYNKEDLSGWDVLQWLRMRNPDGEDLGEETAIIMSIYGGWKQGIFFVEGDKVGLREWQES